MMKHHDFRRGGVASVWVGDFASEIDLDDYLNLSRTFESDFGFELDNRDMPETVVKEASVSIIDLITGFSWSNLYAAEVVDLAKAQGISKATTMLVFLNFDFRPERAKPKETAPLTFLGAVRFHDGQ